MTDGKTVIAGAARTPLGGFMGGLAELSAPQLGAAAIKGALGRSGLAASAVDEVLMGCVLSAGVGMAPARQAALLAGIGADKPAATLNKVCGSGMKAIMAASDAIAAGSASVAVAGGMESMSNAPHLLPKARAGYRMGHGKVLDHMFLDGLQAPCSGDLMGEQAQRTADREGVTREEMDRFAVLSLSRAKRAASDGAFDSEVVAVDGADMAQDELPAKFKAEKIASLKPAFGEGGSITAATASSIADGASAVVLAGADAAEAAGVKPLARIAGHAQFSQAPEDYTAAPVGALRLLLERVGWDAGEVDLYEINEAFALVPLLPIRALGLDEARVNVLGGACALGHPIGCSGNRIVVTLLTAMRLQGAKRGVAAICIGGGEATAIALERD